MSTEKATALVLRVIDFSETSSVVTLLTREWGKVRALAKGGRRPKGPFESALDLLALCRVVFVRKSSEALDLLTEAKLERRFRGRSGDLASVYAGYYVAELLGALTDDYDPHPELFDAATATLADLSGEGSLSAIVLRFELTALRHLGHQPALAQCAECGQPVEAVGRVPFGHLSGGVLCPRCRPGKLQVVAVSAGVIRALERLADPDSSTWRRLELTAAVRNEARAVMNRYVSTILGRPARMQPYLGQLGN